MLRCIYCHANVFPEDKFCHNCGARIKGENLFTMAIDKRYVYDDKNPPIKPTHKKVMVVKVKKVKKNK